LISRPKPANNRANAPWLACITANPAARMACAVSG